MGKNSNIDETIPDFMRDELSGESDLAAEAASVVADNKKARGDEKIVFVEIVGEREVEQSEEAEDPLVIKTVQKR